MEKPTDLEVKYHKLATEYSKVRSQATVLKKAVLEEQAKSQELKDTIKRHEQKIRKHDQEMESLTFRNEQLTKRISVLQQELQVNSHSKKSKNKSTDNNIRTDNSVIDEELQKKILENAQLVSSMADKEFELGDYQERVAWLEKKIESQQKEAQEKEGKYLEEIAKLKKDFIEASNKLETNSLDSLKTDVSKSTINNEELTYWKKEADRWKSECEFLRSKPNSDDELAKYYESQIGNFLEAKEIAQAEARSYLAENQALYARLEYLMVEKEELERNLEKNNEEFVTTTENYKGQLDAMTEHLAAQNDKITKQCDEIQALKHKLSARK